MSERNRWTARVFYTNPDNLAKKKRIIKKKEEEKEGGGGGGFYISLSTL